MSSRTQIITARAQLSLWVVPLTLALFIPWDTYIGGVRPLDLLGLGLLLAGTIFSGGVVAIPATPTVGLMILVTGSAFSILRGVAIDPENWKAGLGLLFGLTVLILTQVSRIEREKIYRWSGYLIIVQLVLISAQYIAFYTSGVKIDLHAWHGRPSMFGTYVFRPGGLHMEPAGYSASIFILLILRRVADQGVKLLDYVAVLSVLATLSLWGAVVSIYLLLSTIHADRKKRHHLTILLSLMTCAVILMGFPPALREVVHERFTGRIVEVMHGEDSSAQQRYKSLEHISGGDIQQYIFGNGFHTGVAGNMLMNSVLAFGILGTLLGLGAVLLLANGKVRAIFWLLLLSTAGNGFITFGITWAWLGLSCRLLRNEGSSTTSRL